MFQDEFWKHINYKKNISGVGLHSGVLASFSYSLYKLKLNNWISVGISAMYMVYRLIKVLRYGHSKHCLSTCACLFSDQQCHGLHNSMDHLYLPSLPDQGFFTGRNLLYSDKNWCALLLLWPRLASVCPVGILTATHHGTAYGSTAGWLGD